MHAHQDDYTAWLAELTRRSAEDLQRYQELVSRAVAAAGDERLKQEMNRIAGEETLRYLQDASRLTAQYYASLHELGRRYTDRFLDHFAEGPRRRHQPGEGRAEPTPQTIPYLLRGAAGAVAHGAFMVENKRNAPVDVSFILSDFRDLDDGSVFRAPVDFRPPHLALDPNGEGQVSLELPLHAELFQPHHRYVAELIVRGHDDLHMTLTVEVDPAAAETPADREADKEKPARPRARRVARPKRSKKR